MERQRGRGGGRWGGRDEGSTHTCDEYPRGQKEAGVAGAAGEVDDFGDGVGVGDVDGYEADERCGRGIVQKPAGGG